MMAFFMTEMKLEHIPFIAELEKECFSEPWSENALMYELENENSHFTVAHENGNIYGYIGVQEICGEAYITNIAVFEKYRGKGIGRELLRYAVNSAAERHCEFITLEVRESNSPAITLYESEGFKLAGMRKGFYSEPSENGLIYTKYL